MDKIWLKSYPEGVPTEIDPDQYRSLVHLLEESFSKYADRNAYVCMDKFLTYRELDAYSRKLAAWLQSRGMAPGATAECDIAAESGPSTIRAYEAR